MSTYANQCNSAFIGNGIIPMDYGMPTSATYDDLQDTYHPYVRALGKPIFSGHFTSNQTTPVIGTCDGSNVTWLDNGKISNPVNRHAYAWNAHVTDVELRNQPDYAENTRQVNTVYGFTMSEDNWQYLQDERQTIHLFAPFFLDRKYLDDARNGTADCSDILGNDCARDLTAAVHANPMMPAKPDSCKDRFGRKDAFKDAMSFTFRSNSSLAARDVGYTDDTGLIYYSEGFSLDPESQTNTNGFKNGNADNNIGQRYIDESTLCNGFPARSIYLSRAFALRTHEQQHDEDLFRAARAKQPFIMTITDSEDTPLWSSIMCVQANMPQSDFTLPRDKGYGDGSYKSSAHAGKKLGRLALVAGGLLAIIGQFMN